MILNSKNNFTIQQSRSQRKNLLSITPLVLIIIIGFIIRLGVVVNNCSAPIPNYPTMDEMNYRELASNILNYKTYATWSEGFYTQSTRAPIYPLSIASAYYLSNSKAYYIPKIMNFIIDMINIMLIFLLALYLFNRKIAILSSGIYAFFGHAPYYMSITSPHTLAVMLLLLAIIALITIKRNYWLATFALSIVYTILIHTRPVFLIILPFLYIAIWIQLSSYHHNWSWIINNWKKKMILSLIPIALIITLSIPWCARNYSIHKTIVPVCTVAGWHIASNENYDLKLSIKYLMNQIYNPKRRTFSEGEYFKEAERKMVNAFLINPLKFIGFGFGRLIYSWTPPGPIYRCLLPKSYFFPNRIFNNNLLPLLDFEGFIYITIFSNIALIFLIGKQTYQIVAIIAYKARGMIILIGGYSIVHIIGIPLIAYRFIIEPVCIILFITLMIRYFNIINQKYNIKFLKKIIYYSKSFLPMFSTKNNINNNSYSENKLLILLYLVIFLILIFLLIPLSVTYKRNQEPRREQRDMNRKQIIAMRCPIEAQRKICTTDNHRNNRRSKLACNRRSTSKGWAINPTSGIKYPIISNQLGVLTYNQLRDMQWKNLGNIKPNTIVKVQGVVKYIHKGFKYVEDDYYAKTDPSYAAGRVYVEYGSIKAPLGIGDVRVNFKNKNSIPKENDIISIIGKATTDPFKAIIIEEL